jgi:hypothetical protein
LVDRDLASRALHEDLLSGLQAEADPVESRLEQRARGDDDLVHACTVDDREATPLGHARRHGSVEIVFTSASFSTW